MIDISINAGEGGYPIQDFKNDCMLSMQTGLTPRAWIKSAVYALPQSAAVSVRRRVPSIALRKRKAMDSDSRGAQVSTAPPDIHTL